jgi:PhoH-like ATPase
MSRKTFVLDTNILLHDPDAIKKFHDNDVIIPMMVLEELDSLKRNSDELGKNARSVLRFIDSLKEMKKGNLHDGVEIDKNINVKILLEYRQADKKNFPLSIDRNSTRMLYNAYQLQDEKKKVVLVSKDFVTRVKAEALGIEAEDYENSKTNFDHLYKGYRKIDVSKQEIDQFIKDGFIALDNHEFNANEYAILQADEHSTVVTKYNKSHKRLEPLLKVARDIWGIQPLNFEQKCALDLLLRDDIKLVTLIGQAGTGKTLLALAAALHKVFDEGSYNKILVSRPIIPLGKDIGYLPGTKDEKLFHWMQPIFDNLEFLCQSSSGIASSQETQKWIMESQKIEMEAVTYIRGRTLPKMFIIVDEAQNLTPHEVKTIISRAGKGTKVILTGDPTQIDNPYLDKDSNALSFTVSRFKNYPLYGHVTLDRTERSELAALAAEVL